MAEDGCQITLDAVQILNISEGLLKRKLKKCIQWFPKLLYSDFCCLQEANIPNLESEGYKQILVRSGTSDYLYIYQFDPESKQQSNQWPPWVVKGPNKCKAERAQVWLIK